MITRQQVHEWKETAHYVSDIIQSHYPTREMCSMYEENAGDVLYAHFIANAWKYNGLFEVLSLEYDPLDNVNEITDETTYRGKVTTTSSGNDSSNSSDSSNTGRVGYEAGEMEAVDSSSGVSNTSATSNVQSESFMSPDDKDTFSRRRHGNIGITTSDQLIAGFMNTRQFAFYNSIANDIIVLLCLRDWGLNE